MTELVFMVGSGRALPWAVADEYLGIPRVALLCCFLWAFPCLGSARVLLPACEGVGPASAPEADTQTQTQTQRGTLILIANCQWNKTIINRRENGERHSAHGHCKLQADLHTGH